MPETETEIDHRLYTIRRLASSARNGHPINVGHLANEILTLDSMLSAGATPPEAWREGPDAPELDGALPALPGPVAGDDEGERAATCPYVYTDADAERVRQNNAEYVARMLTMHGDDANIHEQPVPVPGETCGAELMLWDKDPVVRYLYTEGGRWIAGPSSGQGDAGEDEEVNCGKMHYWAVPEIDEWQ